MLVNKPGVYEMSMPDDDQHCLKLQRVRSADVGQLVVVASNQFGSDLCTLQLVLAGRVQTNGSALPPTAACLLKKKTKLLTLLYSGAQV